MRKLNDSLGTSVFPAEKRLHEIFEYYAVLHPEKTALIFNNQEMSYEDFNKKSNQLAQHLQKLGTQPDQLVALCLERSFDMLIGIMGILKAGAAYVPIDVDYPNERRAFMMQDADAQIILTQQALVHELPETTATVICLDSDWDNLIEPYNSENIPNVNVKPHHLAYTIYTSGSTGKPKGVMISHENLIYQLEGQQAIAPTPIECMLLTCSISFDVSVLTIFWTLLQGATLVLPRQGEEKDMQKLSNIIDKYKVSHILTLPSLHTLILDQAPAEKLQSLRLINVSGEVCPTSLAQRHEKKLPHVQLYNLYGPTEATVNCTYFTIPKGFDEPKVPIGCPILNYDILILNEQLEEVPHGEVGEIYIGGSKPVVGRGYWNRPKLSAERFIKNPLEHVRGGNLLYKTGDLARWMSDGNVEFLGRADYQVKFRGFRIELGEIEVVIGRHKAVREVVVLLKNPHEIHQQKLVAYVTLHEQKSVNVTQLRDFMSETLPEYMLPSAFVFIEKMPLTTNGKFDRKALPDPAQDRPDLSVDYVEPETDLEIYLTQIWEILLDIQPIGKQDKFFELGGNSIQAAQFIGQLQEQLGTSIFITTIFDKPTIEEYAKLLQTSYKDALIHLDLGLKKKEKPALKDIITPTLSATQIDDFIKYIPKLSILKESNQEKKAPNPPAIFILAPPRSGTTLLRVMLAGHPDLFAANELQLLGFNTLSERSAAFSGKFSLWSEGLVRAVMELKNLNANDAKDVIQQYEKKGYTTQQFYKEIQNWIGNKILVDKSPSYVLDSAILEKAEQDFDNSIYIHLVRHPYSMVTSFEKYRMEQVLYLNQHDYEPRALGELVWLHSQQNTVNFLKNIPQRRQFRILYEDLVRQPEKVMNELCERIGLRFHKGLLNPYQDLDKKMIDGIYQDSRSMGDTNMMKQKSINAKSANKWKGVLSDNFLCDTTWRLVEDFGYKFSPLNPRVSINTASQKVVVTPSNNEIPEKLKQSNSEKTKQSIAIIGMSCRLPGAKNITEFWQNLVNSTDVSEAVTYEEMQAAGLSLDDLQNANRVKRKLSLKELKTFDAAFFGYHPKEATLMDPQHRIFLEEAYTALENAGYSNPNYVGKIGVFGGVSRNSYFTHQVATHTENLKNSDDYQHMMSYEKNFSVTRVAYKLNLKGPAINVQTACSTTGVSVHLACQSIQNGDSDIVLVGGGRVQPHLESGYDYIEGGPLSPDGYIRAFDANAKGMIKGNGMAFLVLKSLDKAIEDGDYIWATIKGTAVNNDGSDKIGFTAPSIQGQAAVIEAAQQNAGVSPKSISYIETHGTGTLLGDPIEMQGLTTAFRKNTDKKQFCAVGSVKTNVGHLDAGACVAGIIKTALALKMEQLPASLHFENPNPQIDFKNSPFYVNATLKPWTSNGLPRRAGVSSFGLGGTNVHIILEESPVKCELDRKNTISQRNSILDRHILLLSAKTETALSQSEGNLIDFLKQNPHTSKRDIAFTLGAGRQHFKYRKVLLVDSIERRDSSDSERRDRFLKPVTSLTTKKLKNQKIVFMFPGGGAQYVGMAKDLYHTFPYFKTIVDECFSILKREHDLDIKELVFPENTADLDLRKTLERPSLALASLFTIEYAMAKLWIHWGIRPTEMIGHSMGEYTAACIAGVMSLEDALALVTIRGLLFEQLPAEGGMLSVPMSENAVRSYLNGQMERGELSIAVINKPDNCVISGQIPAIDDLQNRLEEDEVESTKIRISVAAHSPQIEPILEEFHAFLKQVKFSEPTIPFISNVTGDWADKQAVTTPEYWLKHIRQTVRFSDGLAQLMTKPNKIFLEIGPGQTLSTFARQHPSKSSKSTILATLRHPKEPINDVAFLQKNISKLWVNGLDINWNNYYEKGQRIPLPTYPFERKEFWMKPFKNQTQDTTTHLLNRASANDFSTISNHLNDTMNAPIYQNGNGHAVAYAPEIAPTVTAVLTPAPMPQISRKENLILKIKNILNDLSGLAPEEMEEDATFLELGFDSLFLSQAVIQFNKAFGTNLSFRQLFEEASSIEDLGTYLDETLAKELFMPELKEVPKQVFNTEKLNQVIPSSNGNGQNKQQYIANQLIANTQNFQPLNIAKNGQNNIPPTSEVQDIINQQLHLMQQQLILLQSGGQLQNQLANNAPTKTKLQTPKPNSKPKLQTPKPQISNAKNVSAKLKGFGKSNKTSNQLSNYQQQKLQDFIQKYCAKTKGSKEQAKVHRLYYSDPRTLSGFNKNWKEIVYQLAGERSKGSKFWDVDGNEYIDYVMSYGVALFGHSPDFVQEAAIAQLQKGTALDILAPQATELAKILCELSGMDRATLANTGTEAVVGAVRAARAATGKDMIAVFDTDYHGLTDEFMVRGINIKGKMRPMPLAAGVPKYVADNVLILEYDDPDVLNKIKANASRLAAVLIEPVQAQNPHWQHHDILPKIRQVTEELDVALIFDEIINGFRLHQQGAQAWYDIKPDLVTYGKTISGGLPLAAIVGKHRYMEVFDGGLWKFGDDSAPEGTVTYYAGTFIKNPVSVAASLAAMRVLQERGPALQEELNAKAARFTKRLKDLFLRTKSPMYLQATSSFFIIKMADNNPTNSLFYYFLNFHGINMRARPCFISTAHTEEDFDRTFKAIEAAIMDMFERGLLNSYEGVDLNDIYFNGAEHILPISQETQSPFYNSKTENIQNLKSYRSPLEVRGDSVAPLTEGQQEIFLNDQFSREASAAYNIGTEIQLKGVLNQKALENAIAQIVHRHEALRTTISKDGKTQQIAGTVKPTITFVDLSLKTAKEQAKTIAKYYQEVAEYQFDLQTGPLVRFKIIKKQEQETLLFISVHHVICDGWSLGIITRELGELYAALSANVPPSLSLNPKQLSQYATELEQFKDSTVFKKNEQYWLKEYEKSVPVLELPTDFARPVVKTYPGAIEKLHLSPEFYKNLKKVAAKNGTTFYVFMLGAFHTFLHRLSQQDDFVIGVAAAGHNLSGNQNLVGHCINLLPVRLTINGQDNFKNHIKNVRGKILDAFDHQQYTFGTLVKNMKVNRNSSRNTLISVAFNMDSPLADLNYGNLQATTKALPKNYETFDVFINLKPVDNHVEFEWNYNSDLFRAETIKNRLLEFETLLKALAENTEQSVFQLPILPQAEQRLLAQFNVGKVLAFPSHKTLHQLLEEQASKTPHKAALRFGKQSLTFQEFNEQANELSHYLRFKGLKNGTMVGVSLDRSLEMLISVFGVLKAGGSYVPMDARNPQDRLKLMLEDAQCQFLLTQQDLVQKMPDFDGIILAIDDRKWTTNRNAHLPLLGESAATSLSYSKKIKPNKYRPEATGKQNPNLTISPTQVAYVIYTSGSTGKPKGVAVRHENAINTLFGINQHLKLSEKDRLYSVSSMSFDMSIPDYFLAPAMGTTLILAEENTKKDGFLLKEDIEKHRPTVMQATPTTWKILLLAGWQGDKNMTIVAGGEAFSKKLAADLYEKCAAVWNGYGPTETTIYTTYRKITPEHLAEKGSEYAAIGRPIANAETMILDEHLQALPVGVPGELYIGGLGVSNGYLNRATLTEKMFIPHPFKTSQKLYKTGDSVCYLPTGDIDFLGRLDGQVKIRGYRIELGEIEACLKQEAHVKQAAVTVISDKNGDKRLAAYIIMKGGQAMQEEVLKRFIKQQLPGFMVPAFFVEMEKFPLTTSLKVNRKALPKPDIQSSEIYVSPKTPLEKTLVQFFETVLDVPKVGINDDFFDLGGHSLVAVELMMKIHEHTDEKLPLTTLFQYPTVQQLAQLLSQEEPVEIHHWHSLIPLRAEGSKAPIYLVHGGGLHVLFYQTLIKYLDDDQPVFALQARGLSGDEAPLDRIEDMAAHYIEEILMQNPDGPYSLAGYSLGGLIAYEMAQQLQAMGKEVKTLALFDAVAKEATTADTEWWKKMKKTGYNVSLLFTKPMKAWKYKSELLKMRLQHRRGNLDIAYRNNETQTIEEGAVSNNKIVYEKSMEAFANYQLKPIQVKIDLFKAADQMFYLKDFNHLGWLPFAKAGIEVHEVPGDHLTLFNAPSDRVIGERLRMLLE